MSWFSRNPLDRILPGEPMPGVPEHGSAAEVELIEKIGAERPWRGLWYGFFYFLRQWRTTGYMLVASMKFHVPIWSFVPLTVFGLWADMKDHQTALDLNLSDRTLITHILRQEPLRPAGRPNWRSYFTNSFIGGFVAFLAITPIAMYGSLRLSNACGLSDQALPALCAGSHLFLLLGPTFCILAAYTLCNRLGRFWTESTMSKPFHGVLTRKFWWAGWGGTFVPVGYFGLYTKVVYLVVLVWMLFLVVALPSTVLSMDGQNQSDGYSFVEVILLFRWWMLSALFYCGALFFLSFIAPWPARGAGIAARIRYHLSLSAPEEQTHAYNR